MVKNKLIFLFLVIIFIGNQKIYSQNKVIHQNSKIVIAHRGASGYLPEHTLISKSMAYGMHANYLEQDLVLSKDNIPMVVHDIFLDDITDVAKVFPDKSRNDGRYYVIDFTYDELAQLHVFERFDPKTKKLTYTNRFPYNKSTFRLHSFQEEIELIQGLNHSTGNNVGIYPEIKNPKFHGDHGKDISNIVLKILSEYGYSSKSDNCILQCFDKSELKRIRHDLNSQLFLVQLIGHKINESNLKEFSSYADGIGPWYQQIDKLIIEEAHLLGLKVHAYTFRSDDLGNFESFDDLLNYGFNKLNLDGIFTDFPDKAVNFLNRSH